MDKPQSAAEFLERQIARLRQMKRRPKIVFPEGDDARIQKAAAQLQKEGLIEPVLVGKSGVEPEKSTRLKEYGRILYERRRSRGITEQEAQRQALNPLFFGGLMVAAGDADGYVGGAIATTADTFRACVLTIGPKTNVKTISSLMLLCVQEKHHGVNGVLAVADPALVIDPTANQLADIAIATAQSVRSILGGEPIVALLSFSTKGSAKHPFVSKVVEARRIVEARESGLHIDGELQADAALVPAVGRSKAPGSTVAGRANTLIFPDVASANISMKMVERLGGAVTYGPFFQGLQKAANDLPRGCSADDIYGVGIVTALQALG